MDFSGLEAQVFIGVAVILGCAFVALLCDYLKGVNERLRERSLELTVRLEESERWRQHTVQAPQLAAASDPDAQQDVLQEIARLHREVERVSVSVASIAHLQSAVTPEVSQPVSQPATPQPVTFEPKREMAPAAVSPEPVYEPVHEPIHELVAVAVAEPEVAVAPPVYEAPLPPLQPAFPPEVAAREAADPGLVVIKPEVTPALANILRVPPRQTPPVSLQELMVNVAQEQQHEEKPLERSFENRSIETPLEKRPMEQRSLEQRSLEQRSVEMSEPVRPSAMKIRVVRNEVPMSMEPVAYTPPPPVVPMVEPTPVVEPEPVFEPAPAVASVIESEPVFESEPVAVSEAVAAGAAGELSLPSGMHDRATLDFLRADPTPFTGLVVAIGINDYQQLRESTGREAVEDLVRNVTQLVKSITSNLVGPQHFAARASEDEFVVVFNGEIGPAAQRRMAAVSERLWDFQLRSIGTFSVVFSWGATEANEESFAEAIEGASERMRETRQNRKSMGGEKSRKRVVA
jgi:GGDEF domain-containing protein